MTIKNLVFKNPQKNIYIYNARIYTHILMENVLINIFGCWLSLTNSFILKQISLRGLGYSGICI